MELSPYLVLSARQSADSFSPASLLRAQNKAVRFHGREDELRRLVQWCTGEGGPLRLLTGPGGQGKTRLALELMTRLGAEWTCGFLDATTDKDCAAVTEMIERAARPTLLVVDYAETRPRSTCDRTGQIETLTRAVTAARREVPLRLLLLSRSAGDWWEQIIGESAELGHMLRATEVTELAALERSAPGRQQLFKDAWEDFALRLEDVLPDWRRPRLDPPDLRHERYDAALMVHMEALACLLEPERDVGARHAEEVILAHEEPYWRRAARAAGITVHPRTQRRAVAAAALFGAADEPQAQQLLAALPDLSTAGGDERLRVALWLQDLYPAPSGESTAFWGSLQPDLLAEYLVAAVLREGAELLGPVVPHCAPRQVRRGLTVLARAGLHQPEVDDRLRAWVGTLGEHLPEAVRVVAETENPGPLLEALDGLDREALPHERLVDLADAIPHRSRRLAYFAAEVQADITAHARKVRAADGSEPTIRRLATALAHESARLEDVGRRVHSLRALEEAVALRETMTGDTPGQRLELARMYISLAAGLSANGRTEEAARRAQQAFNTLNALKDADLPLVTLLRSLGALALRLMEAGRGEEAIPLLEWVTDSYRKVIAVMEADAASERSAVDGIRDELAKWQNNLAGALHHAGRHEEALFQGESAVAARRELAEARPDVYLAGLAASLNNLVGFQWSAGDARAMETAYEAVAVFETLTLSNPAAFLHRFVAAVRHVMSLYIRTPDGDSRRLTQVAMAVTRLYGQLRESRPWVFLPVLVSTVHLPGDHERGAEKAMHMLMDRGSGQPRDVRQADEAVSLYRNLCSVDRKLYEPYLVRALTTLADLLDAALDPGGARGAIQELIVLQRTRVDVTEEDRSNLLWALNDMVRRLADAEQFDAAVPYARELVDVLRKLPDHEAAEWRRDMASALYLQFNMVQESSGQGYVFEEMVEFAELCDGLGGVLDDEMLRSFGKKLIDLVMPLTENDQPHASVGLAEVAYRLSSTLYRRSPKDGEPGLCRALSVLGECYRIAGRVGDAVVVLVRGIESARRLGNEGAESIAWQAMGLAARADPEEAKAAWHQVVRGAPFPEFRVGPEDEHPRTNTSPPSE
ncbi:hypothetical protein ACFQ0X_02325 [Streptomyces rectiviolaceus]|uniref:hypothetical protein n=1 Tax=Streptomyces rectiviolaceus TaxID=332591 RepID=UPI003641956A